MSSSVETPTAAGKWWQGDDAELRPALTDMQTAMRRDSGGRRPRDTPERLGDAFVDILRLAAGNDDVPSQGGEKPTVVVTVPLEVLEKEVGTALLQGGTFLSAAHARMLAWP